MLGINQGLTYDEYYLGRVTDQYAPMSDQEIAEWFVHYFGVEPTPEEVTATKATGSREGWHTVRWYFQTQAFPPFRNIGAQPSQIGGTSLYPVTNIAASNGSSLVAVSPNGAPAPSPVAPVAALALAAVAAFLLLD